ncbi:RNA-directed DNA polymerase, eukaryota, reverse transcriptase zinc-binding domain protein [Tanacetum coccineum]
MENENLGGLVDNKADENNGIGEKSDKDFPSIVEVHSSPVASTQFHNDSFDKHENSNYVQSENKNEHVTVNKSFIKVVKKNNEYKSELELIPTGLEEGREVVFLMKKLLMKGNVGRRGPWMVRNKPLLVQKWDPSLCIEKKELEVIPLWIKLCNVPLEAWSNKGISAIASSIGKPVIMDQTTTEMCNKGMGRIGYARVLVEVNAKNKLKNSVKICYKNAKKETCLTKFVNVVYDWMPPRCEFCKETRNKNNGMNQKESNNARDKREFGMGKQTAGNGNANLEYKPRNKEKNVGTQDTKDTNEQDKGKTINEIDEADLEGSMKNIDLSEVEKFLKIRKQPTYERLECKSDQTMLFLIQSRHNPKNGVLKKIDKVLGNNSFMGNFPSAHAIFLPRLSSDHCPAVLYIPKMARKKKKAFKFANYTAKMPEFLDIVKKKVGYRSELQNIQTRVDARPHDADLKREEARIMKEYSTALQDEESFLCQQAKIDWLNDGDKNNKFFHAILKSRNHKSRVGDISNENGEMFEEMGGNFIPVICVSNDAANNMIKKVSKEEIKAAIFDIDENKAPRLDGFSLKFFKKAWSIVGDDVCFIVLEFFHNRKFLGEVNATSISLVPKPETPSKVYDFRPIAYYNVIYKCISKILTDMIKKALCEVVSSNQSAFIPGRQITNNILISQELLRVLKGALDEFNMISGLVPNMGKSTVFFRNLKNKTMQEIIDVMPFKVGSLLVNYLGVPLITKQIGIGDCKCLVDKALAFMLPKMTIKDINKLLKGFLWCQGEMTRGKAKIAWENVCLPKHQGGLGLKILNIWNEILMANIYGTLLAAKNPYGWKQILNLRGKMRKHVVSQIGNGEKIFFCHDNWSGKGPLSSLVGQEAMKHQSINTMDKVSDLWSKDGWKWPSILKDNPTFNGLVSNILESSGCDCIHLVVFSVYLGLGRKMGWDDEK